MYQPLVESESNMFLEESHRQIVDGLLLGDGCVQRQNRTARLSLGSIQKEFVEHVCSVLPLQFSPVYYRSPVDSVIEGRIVHCKASYLLRSRVDSRLDKYRDKWYPDGKKIVPSDLELSPISVKYWFYGDGSTYWARRNQVTLDLSSHGFGFSGNELLADKLREVGLSFGSVFLRTQGNFHLRCEGGIAGVRKFFDYIGRCDVPCFQYKWKIPYYAPFSKLTPDTVREARLLYDRGGYSYESLGKKFGVGMATMSDAIKRRTWKCIV